MPERRGERPSPGDGWWMASVAATFDSSPAGSTTSEQALYRRKGELREAR
jgi:hypothetical protein